MIKVNLPESITVSLRGDCGDFEFDISKLSEATVAGALAKGLKETSDDYGSRGDSDDEKAANVVAGATRIQANEHTFGGGGSRVSDAVKIAREIIAHALKKNGLADTMTAANKAVVADLDAAYDLLELEKPLDEFMVGCAKIAARRAKEAESLI